MIDSLYTATPQLQPTCAASGSIEDSRSVSDGSQIQLELDLADSRDCWTTLRRDLISNDNLARVGRGHGLHKCINMNGGTTRVPSQLPWNSPVTSACDPRVCLGCLLKKRQKQVLCQLGCRWSSLLTLLDEPLRQAPRIIDWEHGGTEVAAG
uniref:Uncharacterized protein n=1 Tax=Fusarium oxysporum (strain Fo5176) TaxID=660025 RepID=A0A0D2YAC0_FUSOF